MKIKSFTDLRLLIAVGKQNYFMTDEKLNKNIFEGFLHSAAVVCRRFFLSLISWLGVFCLSGLERVQKIHNLTSLL